MKKSTLLIIILLSLHSLAFSQSQKKTIEWIEAKLPVYLISASPISETTEGGEVNKEDNFEISVKNECALAIRKNGNKSSGFTISTGALNTIEKIDSTALILVTEGEKVSFLGNYKDKPKQTEMLKTSSAKLIFSDEEARDQVYNALEQLAKKCDADLVKDDLFED